MNKGSWRFCPKLLSTGVVACLLVLLCSLGSWQWSRSVDKRALIAQFDEGSKDVVLRVAANSELEKFPHRIAELSGSYDTDRQFLLDNRTHEGIAGYHVLTPFMLAGTDSGVFVNRGWLPVGASRDILPEVSVTTVPVTVIGTIAPVPRVFLLGGSGHDSSDWPRVVQSVDWAPMEAALGKRLLRAQILLGVDQPDGYERAWTAYYGISPERHQAYSVQWYGLALTLLVLYMVVSVKRGRSI